MNAWCGNSKLVSIVLPVYNGARFLRRAIESCLGQTYCDVELIVVDDGSKDDSIDIVRAYNDSRLKLVCHEINKKLPAALNTGFEHASGGYLTWTSVDNYYAPNAITEMVRFLEEHPQVHFVFADYYVVNEIDQSPEYIERLQDIETGSVEQLLTNWVGACFLYRRIVYEKVGPYNEHAFLAEDYEYWLRVSAYFTFAHLGHPMYYYSLHPDSLTSRYDRGEVIEAALAVQRQVFGRNLWRNRVLLSRAHLSAASGFYQRNIRTAAARNALWGIALDPRCLLNHRVQMLVTGLCFSQRGRRILKRLRHVIRRSAIHSSLPD